MTNVCTHAGLRSSEQRLWIPESMFFKLDCRAGEASRELAGLSGGEGRRLFVCFLPIPPARPDSKAYGEMDERRLDILRR